MKIIDISQELFSGAVYPGDMPPKLTVINTGQSRLSNFECCAHNGTHIDSPNHFINGGGDIESLQLEKCMGVCKLAHTAENAGDIKKLIIRGQITAADAQNLTHLDLIGTNEQSVGDAEVHRLLLESGVVILEGLRLDDAADGIYNLIALPLRLRGADGSPVRAVLITQDECI